MHHADVAARPPTEDDRLGAVLGLYPVEVLFDDVVGFIPADLLPLVSLPAELTGAFHGVQQAPLVLDDLGHRKAAHAQPPLVVRVLGVALNLDQVPLFVGVAQHAAAVMASRRRPCVAARDSEIALLPPARHFARCIIDVSRELHAPFSSHSPSYTGKKFPAFTFELAKQPDNQRFTPFVAY